MLRVSEVLNYHPAPFLVKWEKRKGWAQCQRIREEALDIGTEVDRRIRWDLTHPKPSDTVPGYHTYEVGNCMKAWTNFKASPEGGRFYIKAVRFKANMQKELVLDDLMGHPDFIFDDELPDLKTSKSINISHWMQVAQYAKMINDGPYVYSKNSNVSACSPRAFALQQAQQEMDNKNIIKRISILRLDKYDERGVWEYKVLGEPFIGMLQEQFNYRHEAMIASIEDRQLCGAAMNHNEEKSFADLMRKKLEVEKLS